MFVEVVYTLKRRSTRNRECERSYTNLQLALHLIEQVERILAWAVQLIDKDHYRGVAHAAYIHQSASLRLDTLCAIDYDNYRIYGREGTVCILGKVLVTGSVKDIDFHIFIVESHHRCCHRDTTLTLNLHKVGGRSLLDFITLHRTRNMDSTTKEEQLLRQCGLTRVWVGNNCKCSSSGNLFVKSHSVLGFLNH